MFPTLFFLRLYSDIFCTYLKKDFVIRVVIYMKMPYLFIPAVSFNYYCSWKFSTEETTITLISMRSISEALT